MKWENIDKLAALEKAIKDKYGEMAILNPRSLWNPEKEKEYIEETKKAYSKEKTDTESQEINGVLVDKKLINKVIDRTCKLCNSFSFVKIDDVYLTKFGCCYKCYLCKVEGR
jgi:hypothetical protein